jgi:hypothetical protein
LPRCWRYAANRLNRYLPLQDDGECGEAGQPRRIARQTYVIKTASGGQVTLDAAHVKEVTPKSAEMKYDQVRTSYLDTVEGNGNWPSGAARIGFQATENAPGTDRRLDANHEEARHALGTAWFKAAG